MRKERRMIMNTKTYTTLPQEAKDIRIEVFVKEQGFENEFDEIDTISHHIVAFDERKPIGTCRFFQRKRSLYHWKGGCIKGISKSTYG